MGGTGTCCPLDTVCLVQSDNYEAYCCPTSDDCSTAVNAAPTCADASWSLWLDSAGHYFCCLPGQIGIDGEICVSANVPPASATIATSKTQANTAAPTGTGGSSSGSQSKTATVTGSHTVIATVSGSTSASVTTTPKSTTTKSGNGISVTVSVGKSGADRSMVARGFLSGCGAALALCFLL